MSAIVWSDFGRIQWGPTLKLALARSLASGLVIGIILVVVAAGEGASALGGIGLWFLMWSATSFVGAPLTSLMIRGLNVMFAGMGLGIAVLAGNIMLFMLAVAVASGDPLVYFVNRRFPRLLEVDDFKLLNMQPTIFVIDGAPTASRPNKHDFL